MEEILLGFLHIVLLWVGWLLWIVIIISQLAGEDTNNNKKYNAE